jgi:ribosomal protein L7Ae-like RNA K-turn-binding protein
MKFRKENVPTFKSPPSFKSKSKAGQDDMTVPLWKRLGVTISKNDIREKILQKVKNAVDAKAKIGKELIVGFNCVCKAVEKNEASVLCISKDSGSVQLLHTLVEMSYIRKIPLVVVPGLSATMLPLVHLKSVSCFCIRKSEIASHNKSNNSNSSSSSIKFFTSSPNTSTGTSGGSSSDGNHEEGALTASSLSANIPNEHRKITTTEAENDYLVSQMDDLRDFLFSVASQSKIHQP